MRYQNFLPRLVIFLPRLGNKITRVGNKITRRGNKCAIDIQVLIGMKIYFLGMKKNILWARLSYLCGAYKPSS